ncbi:hypothetical protein WSM22_32320 [Cytophagales bacterium WSM2-2]|nr:hypothetical protein WSM22_32320 [Cytophagales bacterium WSM2-2]
MAGAQTFTDKITKELAFEKVGPNNTLIIANINGSMKVQGYDGDKILIEAERTIKAKTEARLEQGKKEMQLGQIDRFDTLIVYVSGNCNTTFGYRNKKHYSGWSYNSDCRGGDCNPPYDYVFNFTIKVPAGINVEVSTVNNGDVTVTNMKGAVKANNINGAIRLTSLEGPASASTINGDVDIEYLRNPGKDCKYYSLNGDINALFVKGLAANMSFKSFNGALYTNVPKLEGLPASIVKEDSREGLKLRIASNQFKIGNGGALQDFETFNGDVIVKEK